MIQHVFLDFNGTIINDVDLCLTLLNDLLKEQNKEGISLDKYKEVFTFPIRKYYEDAGIDFSIESFESLAVKFINKYQPLSLECGLYPAVIPTLKYLNEKNIHVYILSASEIRNLTMQCEHYKIVSYFDSILGIDNIHAGSKIEIALEFMKEKNINPSEALFIGDTLHDFEVAKAMGVGCRLVSCGHQSVKVLSTAGVPIYEDISAIIKEL